MKLNQVIAVALLVVSHEERHHLERHHLKASGAIVTMDDGDSGSENQYLQRNPAMSNVESANLTLLAKDLLSECTQLAILMSGKENLWLKQQREMYKELQKKTQPSKRSEGDLGCIVVVIYTGPDAPKYDLSWVPASRLVFGKFFHTFITELSTQANGEKPFNGVFVAYTGHGHENLLCTHAIIGSEKEGIPEGTSKDQFLSEVKMLQKMTTGAMLIVVDACNSASMFLSDRAQLLTNEESLYYSEHSLSVGGWKNTTDACAEFQKLAKRYPDLEEILKAILYIMLCVASVRKDEPTQYESAMCALRNTLVKPRPKSQLTWKVRELKIPGVEMRDDQYIGEDHDILAKKPLTKAFIFDGAPLDNRLYIEDVFKKWMAELEELERSLLGKSEGGARFLHGMIRLSAPHLKQPDRPTDLLKEIDGGCPVMAITSAPPTTSCWSSLVFKAMLRYLRERKTNKDTKDTIGSMYGQIKDWTLKHWCYTEETNAEVGEFTVEDYLEQCKHVPDAQPPFHIQRGWFIPPGITIGFGPEAGLDVGVDVLFPLAENLTEQQTSPAKDANGTCLTYKTCAIL